MVSAQSIKQSIEENLECEHVAVAGDGHHFEAVIVSGLFRGKSKVQQHQLVYRALGERMREEIHALSMRTLTPDEWSGQGS
jgi:acid stress-induced BolA-like protein IbaG/YrbA